MALDASLLLGQSRVVSASERLDGRWFVSVAEVAEVLGVDPRTVRRAIEAGEVPAVRVGQRYRVPAAWLRERASETVQKP